MEKLTASEVIKDNTEAYGRYVISHLFPSAYDGLKKVARRILTTLKVDVEIGSADLVSKTMLLHPHSPEAIYQAACRFEEPFSHTFPIFNIIGKGGSYSGDTPAASRYTKMRVSDFASDIFFKGIDFRTIATELGESLSTNEYQYLIPKIPTALLYASETIGFGYSSRTFPMKFENVCDLVIDFIQSENKTKWNGSHLPHLMLPCLPIKVYLVNQDELLEEYSKGNFEVPIETEGIYDIISPTDVLVRTMSYGSTPSPLREKLDSTLKDRNHLLVKKFDLTLDAFSDNRNYADFQLTIKRGPSIFELIDKTKSAMRIRSKFHPVRNYVINNTLVNLSPSNLIKLWYEERYRSVLGTLKYRQQQLFADKMRYETYIIICEHVEEVVAKLRISEEEDFIKWTRERFELSRKQCEILLHANLQVLMKSKRQDLETRLGKINTEIEETNKSFSRINKSLIEEIQHLKNKYKTNTLFTSKVAEWIGCIIIGNLGIIQIKSIDEIFTYGKMFNKPITFVPYEEVISLQIGQSIYRPSSAPFTTAASKIKVTSNKLWFIRNKLTSRLIDNPIFDCQPRIYNLVTKDAWRICKDGSLSKKELPEKSVFIFDGDSKLNYIALIVNTGYPNVIRAQRFKLSDKIKWMPGGRDDVIAVVPEGTETVLCNMPADHRWNLIEITDLSGHLKKDIITDININRMSKV